MVKDGQWQWYIILISNISGEHIIRHCNDTNTMPVTIIVTTCIWPWVLSTMITMFDPHFWSTTYDGGTKIYIFPRFYIHAIWFSTTVVDLRRVGRCLIKTWGAVRERFPQLAAGPTCCWAFDVPRPSSASVVDCPVIEDSPVLRFTPHQIGGVRE